MSSKKPQTTDKQAKFYENCPICTREPIQSGRTQLLYLDDFCFIDRNDKSVLVVNELPISAEMRVTLSLLEHIAFPNEETIMSAKQLLIDYMKVNLGITDSDFITRVTMLTYPEHFHIHGYVLPFKDGTGTIVPAAIYGDSHYLHNPSVTENVRKIANS